MVLSQQLAHIRDDLLILCVGEEQFGKMLARNRAAHQLLIDALEAGNQILKVMRAHRVKDLLVALSGTTRSAG